MIDWWLVAWVVLCSIAFRVLERTAGWAIKRWMDDRW